MRDVFIDPDAPAKRPSPRGGRFSSQAVGSRKALFFCLLPAAGRGGMPAGGAEVRGGAAG